MAVSAYVLITVDTPLTNQVTERLKNVAHAIEVREVIGPYDVIVELEADTYEDIVATVRSDIRPIQGIRTTVTCTCM